MSGFLGPAKLRSSEGGSRTRALERAGGRDVRRGEAPVVQRSCDQRTIASDIRKLPQIVEISDTATGED